MKQIIASVAILLVYSIALSQTTRFAGTHPPDTAVLHLITSYQQASKNWQTVAQRTARLQPFLSGGYFYHGMDGAPVSMDSLTKRQTKNSFSRISDSAYNFTLFQYENTAVLSFKVFEKGLDKGRPYEGTGSWLVWMSKESGSWKVIADVLGQDP